jgi:hypothetical protein
MALKGRLCDAELEVGSQFELLKQLAVTFDGCPGIDAGQREQAGGLSVDLRMSTTSAGILLEDNLVGRVLSDRHTSRRIDFVGLTIRMSYPEQEAWSRGCTRVR